VFLGVGTIAGPRFEAAAEPGVLLMGSVPPDVKLTAKEEQDIDEAYLRLFSPLNQLRPTGSDDAEILDEASRVEIDADLLAAFGRPYGKACRSTEVVTMPIVSGSVAFIDHSYFCGELCGRGTSYGLLKRDGRWVVFLARETWVS
jgi:hypothetical protein